MWTNQVFHYCFTRQLRLDLIHSFLSFDRLTQVLQQLFNPIDRTLMTLDFFLPGSLACVFD
jgi:hypothetical protein